MFNQLEKLTYPEQIAQRIRTLILERQLGAGDRLPSERVMAERFGVSRSSIREGIKLLAALGWVEIRTGDGTYISSDLTGSVLKTLSWAVILTENVASDLVEARLVIEPNLAALSAKRANEENKAEILETIERMENNIGESGEVVKADLDFHIAIAKSSGNQMLFETLVGLQHIMRSHLEKYHTGIDEQKHALKDHCNIYDAIRNGDAAAARKAMVKSIVKDKANVLTDFGFEYE